MKWNKLQENSCKNYKYVETKQHAAEQPLGQWRNQRVNLRKYLKTNENENRIYQNLWDAVKMVLKGSL